VAAECGGGGCLSGISLTIVSPRISAVSAVPWREEEKSRSPNVKQATRPDVRRQLVWRTRNPTIHLVCSRVHSRKDAGERRWRSGFAEEETADIHRIEGHGSPRRAMGRRGQGKGRGHAGDGG